MDTTQEKGVTLRWLAVTGDDVANTLLAAGVLAEDRLEAAKTKALANLGIERREGETALKAWVRTMAEENGIEHTTPAQPQLTTAILMSEAQRFMFWLA